MPLKAFEQKRIYQHVAEHVAELIRGGEFEVGQQLPPERDLAKTLQISRNVVREALLALEIAGYVEIRVGVGTFVVSDSPEDNRGGQRPLDAGASPTDILAARRAIEGEAAAIAATTATDEEIVKVRKALDEIMNDGEPPASEVDWPRVFHARVAEATHNPVMVNIIDQLWAQTRSPMFDNIRVHTGLQKDRYNRQAHRHQLVECLERRDVEGARKAMHTHLDEVAAFIFRRGVT